MKLINIRTLNIHFSAPNMNYNITDEYENEIVDGDLKEDFIAIYDGNQYEGGKIVRRIPWGESEVFDNFTYWAERDYMDEEYISWMWTESEEKVKEAEIFYEEHHPIYLAEQMKYVPDLYKELRAIIPDDIELLVDGKPYELK